MGAPQEAKTGIHPAFGVVFAMNYMMGSGYLTLPKAYADASVAIGVAMTFVMALGACVSAECILGPLTPPFLRPAPPASAARRWTKYASRR